MPCLNLRYFFLCFFILPSLFVSFLLSFFHYAYTLNHPLPLLFSVHSRYLSFPFPSCLLSSRFLFKPNVCLTPSYLLNLHITLHPPSSSASLRNTPQSSYTHLLRPISLLFSSFFWSSSPVLLTPTCRCYLKPPSHLYLKPLASRHSLVPTVNTFVYPLHLLPSPCPHLKAFLLLLPPAHAPQLWRLYHFNDKKSILVSIYRTKLSIFSLKILKLFLAFFYIALSQWPFYPVLEFHVYHFSHRKLFTLFSFQENILARCYLFPTAKIPSIPERT